MFVGIFLTLFILRTSITEVSSKLCQQPHFQVTYCRNEKVFKVKIESKEYEMDRYVMRILEYFKGNSSGLRVWNKSYIHVKTKSFLDQVVKSTFIIFGDAEHGIFVTDDCYGEYPWLGLTFFQKDALFAFYENGCDCISEIPGYNTSTFCIWHYAFYQKENDKCTLIGVESYRECKLRRLKSSDESQPKIF